MNVAADCPECCDCPAPVVVAKSRSVTKPKYGFPEVAGYASPIPKRYKRINFAGSSSQLGLSPDHVTTDFSGSLFYDAEGVLSCDMLSSGSASRGYFWPDGAGPGGSRDYNPCAAPPFVYLTWGFDYQEVFYALRLSSGELLFGPWGLSTNGTLTSVGATGKTWTLTSPFSGSFSATLAVEHTTDDVIAAAVAALAAAPLVSVSGSPKSARNVAVNELGVSLEESRYEIAHLVPKVGNGNGYRVEWVERFVPEVVYDTVAPFHAVSGGASVTSVEILNPGVFRPNLYIFGDGEGAHAVAVMASTGEVESIRLLNPGSGYTEVEVYFDVGDATATAVIDLDEESPNYGRITAINLASGGDYLPELSFGAPAFGGTQAEATCTLDPQGGIATVTVTNAGEFYTTLGLYVGNAVLFVHYGEETARCYRWDGVRPEGYNAADIATFPRSEEFSLVPPEADGEIGIEIKRAVCDGSACP